MTPPELLRYRVCDRPVELEVTDTALLGPLGALFPDYQVRSKSPAAASPTVRVAVGRGREGYVVVDPSGARTECATQSGLLAACEFVLAQAFLASCESCAQLHAAGAVVRGRAVLALGRAGAGKSSLALSWHRSGYPALGDDVVLLDGAGRAHPFKRLYELETETLRQLGVAPEDTCLWEPGSEEAWYDPRGGAGWGGPAPVSLLAVIAYRRDAALTITPLSRAAALNALVHSQIAGTRNRRDHLEALARVAEQAPAVEVTFGAAAEAAAAIAARVA